MNIKITLKMIEKFRGLIGKAMRSVEDSISVVAVEINTFLSMWMIEHIIENDLPIKAYVEKMAEHAAGMSNLCG